MNKKEPFEKEFSKISPKMELPKKCVCIYCTAIQTAR